MDRNRYHAQASETTVPTTLDQNIELRLALPDDIPSINEIRQHSLVAPHQYRISYPLWLEIWLTRLNADISAESFEWRITAVLFDSKIVGHISESRTLGKSGFSIRVGWNLHPDYWGRGVMTTALTEFISNLVSDKQCNSIVADCFEGNERCLRLLARLGVFGNSNWRHGAVLDLHY